jgi:hypothetical protein
MGRTCRTHKKKRNACRILMGKPEGKRPLEGSRRRCEDNIKNSSYRYRMGWYGLN